MMNTQLHHSQNNTGQAQAAKAIQFLGFSVHETRAAVDILRVTEIRRWEGADVLPNSAPWIVGVINVRGNIVPIVELRAALSMPGTVYTKTSVVILVQVTSDASTRTVGMLVDQVSEVFEIAAEEMSEPPTKGGPGRNEYFVGISYPDDHSLVILDLDRLLNDAIDGNIEQQVLAASVVGASDGEGGP